MKIFHRTASFTLVMMLFTACSPKVPPTPIGSQGNDPYAPQASDSALLRGEIRIDSASLALAESYPVQVMLSFAYFQPTPCHQLRVEVKPPDAQNRINVNAYAVAEKDKPCTLMALATPLQANLNLGSFSKGHYRVLLNGNKVGEFDS